MISSSATQQKMNVDAIFKIPAPPVASHKRKNGPSADEAYFKRLRSDDNAEDGDLESFKDGWGAGSSSGSSSSSKAGPSPDKALANSAEEDDEEGDSRFLESGMSDEQKRIWDIVDAGDEAPATIDLPTMKKMVLKFERVINKNQELRVKYADQPIKFIDSEADLDEEIKHMLAACAAPELYPSLVELGTHITLLGLLAHENTDISIAAVELLKELTDDELVEEATEEAEEGIKVLVRALIEGDALDLLIQNMARLNEDSSEDKVGVFNTLSIMENFVSIDPELAETIVLRTTLLPWLLQRVRRKPFDSNRQYASELMAILLQNSRPNRLKLSELGGIDTLLQVVSAYKRKDPSSPDEIEMMENVFDTLCACLIEPEAKQQFVQAEGLDLMLIMLRENKMSRMRAFKVLDHAMSGRTAQEACERFLDSGGLKTLFPALMQKGVKKYAKEYKEHGFSEREEEEHVLAILTSLLKNFVSNPAAASPDKSASPSSYRARVLIKFLDPSRKQVDRLLSLHFHHTTRLQTLDRELANEKDQLVELLSAGEISEEEKQEAEDDIELRRVMEGGFVLQMVDYLLGCIYGCTADEIGSGDDAIEDLIALVKARIIASLEVRGQSLDTLRETLIEYSKNIGNDKEESDEETRAERQTIISVAERLV
ncbi:Catenin-beta-like protein [Phlyctochytrium arcticum]|nr:Catenin-beta-like protein [Phlyctochytrium arcticum]